MNQVAVHSRHGVPHRGDDTRCRLITTAIEMFAEYGYEGAGTRMIAERAGVNLPAIQYHFGSKEGLFRAVIEHIAQQFGERMEPAARRVREGLAADPSTNELFGLLRELLDHFAALMLGEDFPESWRLIIGRAEITDAALLDPLHEAIMAHSVRPCIALLARLLDLPEDDEMVRLRTATIFGQVNIFCKRSIRHNLGWSDYEPERVRTIRGLVCSQTEAMLRALRRSAP